MSSYTHVHSANVPLPTRVCRKLKLCEITVAAMKVEIRRIDFWRSVISECLGTLLYILLGCSSTMACNDHLSDTGYTDGNYRQDSRFVTVSLCFGLTIMALTQCFGHISGGHFNPSISMAMAVTCKITPLRACLYILAQLGGAIAGAAVLYGLAPRTCLPDLGVTSLHPGMSVGQGFGVEFLITFLLVFTVFATSDSNRKEPGSKAIAIGITVAACHLAAFDFTRSAMNPARALGPAFVMNYWHHHWVYWTGPISGGILAGVLYEYIFDPSRGKKRPPLTPSKRASMVEDPEILSPVHANRCARDSYISSNGIPYGMHNGIPSTLTPGRGNIKSIYVPQIVTPPHNGLENHAYSSENHQRRSLSLIQATAPPPPPPAPPETGETILLEDVHVDNFQARQG